MADQINLHRATDANNDPVSGALCYVYEAGTSTPQDTYTDVALSTLHPTPVEADGDGVFPPIFLSGSVKVDVQTPGGASLPGFPRDNFPTSSTTGGAAQQVSFAPQDGNSATNVQDAIENCAYAGNASGPVATTSGTAFDFTGIPAGVTQIEVLLNAVSTNGTASFLVQLGDDGGVEASGYTNAVSAEITTGADLASTSGFPVRVGSASFNVNGSMILTRGAGNDWYASGAFGATGGLLIVSSGSKTLSETLTRVRLTRTSSDTFDNGSVSLRWRYG